MRPHALSVHMTAMALLMAGCTVQPGSRRDAAVPSVLGAGASFPAPLYQRWFSHLLVREQLSIRYTPINSAAGEQQLLAGQIDFAGSDFPATRDNWIQIPTTAGAIAVAYNHPGCELRLNPEQLRKILAGVIHNFSQLNCKASPLRLVVRSDRSGSTAHLLSYLNLSTNQRWHASSARVVHSNEAMATALMQQEGSLGYLDTVYLQGRFKLRTAELRNQDGRFLPPDAAAVDLALRQWPQPRQGYPLAVPTWLLLPKSGLGRKASVMKQALTYGLSPSGQQEARMLGYAPLPTSLLNVAQNGINTIQP